jgi:3-(3-hydroxy-phenyl)propionate hydroxylase
MPVQERATRTGAPVDYQKLVFDYQPHPDQSAATPVHYPVVVVGAGPVGLALAIDLAQQQVPVVLLDNDNKLSVGSRAICFSKRTLEVFDRLGCGQTMVEQGVGWQRGRVFFRDAQVYEFDLLPEEGHERPAFINLQQYYVEGYLAERVAELPLIDLRWQHKVVGIAQGEQHALLTIETPDGPYQLSAGYVAACDGARSSVRQLIGQESTGRVFKDRFLIADVKVQPGQRPPAQAGAGPSTDTKERWFWFDPDFHRHQSVLLHMQPDNVWRIDFQLGWDANPDEEKKPENIIPRVKALLGDNAPFTLEWASVYTFACQRMAAFRHGRVLFAGDAAHGVSPFGARGANSGVQDAENLAWKLAAVLRGQAPDALLDSYAREREFAADENLLNSSRSTDFITPKSEVSRLFRDAVLDLARQHAFARTLVNSGRLSVPAVLRDSSLNTADAEPFAGAMCPGAVAADAPLLLPDQRRSWLLRALARTGFTALVFGDGEAAARSHRALAEAELTVVPIAMTADHQLAVQRYDAQPGTVYLLRPDQHVCARWRAPTAAQVRRALDHALAKA